MRIHLRKARIYYLELEDFEIKNKAPLPPHYYFVDDEIITSDRYLERYKAIGGPWNWSERLLIPREKLEALLLEKHRKLIWLYHINQCMGYIEIFQNGAQAELIYFGLLENYMGKGLGKIMMQYVKKYCNNHNISTLRLHTCEFDSPQAKAFYLKSGFKLVKEEMDYEKHLF